MLSGRDSDADPAETAERRKEFASRCAAAVLTALGPLSDRELDKYLAALPPDQAGGFVLALGGEHAQRASVTSAVARRIISLVDKDVSVTTPAQAAAYFLTVQRVSGILLTDAGKNSSFRPRS